jgi:hypothetical protein
VNRQDNAEQKGQAGGITIHNFKLYYRGIAIKQYGTSTKQT